MEVQRGTEANRVLGLLAAALVFSLAAFLLSAQPSPLSGDESGGRGHGLAPTPLPQSPAAAAKGQRAWQDTRPTGVNSYLIPPAGLESQAAAIRPSQTLTTFVYLPFVARAQPCQAIPGEAYDVATVNPPPTDRPAEEHADLNLSLRGYQPTGAYLGLVSYGGSSDPGAPQLAGLFADNRTPAFTAAYRVYDWDWSCNCRGSLNPQWPVTLAGLGVTPGESIHVPSSGYTIGLQVGYQALVLYAAPYRLTLKYSREDTVANGYTLHLENVCVEPSLLALYQSSDRAGRGKLPALRAGQAVGRGLGKELGIAIRDSGTFLDPRSRNDWWKGR